MVTNTYTNPVIQVENLGKKFCKSHMNSMKYGIMDILNTLSGKNTFRQILRTDEFWALEDISFDLYPGQCLGILGPNGSGKSTLLKILNSIIIQDKGSMCVHGNIAAMIEIGAGFHPMLTGRENIYINGAILGLEKRRIRDSMDEIIAFSGLEEFIDTPVKFYSSGMYVRLGFAIAAQLKPDVLLIDEVLAVGDMRFRSRCLEHIRRLKQEGTTIILVSHNLVDILKTATKCIVLHKGKLEFIGDANDAAEAYHKLMHSYNRASVQKNRDCALIRDVAAMDNSGNLISKFETGRDLQLQIEIESPRNIDNARVIVAIEKPNIGIIASISSAYHGRQIDIRSGLNQINLRLKQIPLLKGYYLVNVSLYGAGSEDFHDRVLGAASFEITSPEIDYSGYGISGCINIEHVWG